MLFGKRDADLGAAAGFALESDFAAVVHGRVLDDGQAETRAAGGLGVALVDAVEALKDPALVLGRNADAGIKNRDGGFLLAVFNMDADAAAGTVIFDGVVAEIVKHLI